MREVGILLFDGVEVLDFAGPYEVFSVASRLGAGGAQAAAAPFRVSTIAASQGLIAARNDLGVMAARGIAQVPALEILIVPGGIVDAPLADPDLLSWITTIASEAEVIASVCTGAFVLGKAGLLNNLEATTHWDDLAQLRADYPTTRVRTDVPYVDQGKIVTSAGVAAGIAMSLHLVARLAGSELAQRTARQIEFSWTPCQ